MADHASWVVQHDYEAAHIDRLGFVAVEAIGSVYGAGKDAVAALAADGGHVVALAPDDPAGHAWMGQLHAALGRRVRSFTMVTPPAGRSIRSMVLGDLDASTLPPFPLREREPLDPKARAKQRERFLRESRRELDEEEAAANGRPWPSSESLKSILANPSEDAGQRVTGLTIRRGRVDMVAAHKAGKTTLTGNYVLSVLSGKPFLAPPDRTGLFAEMVGWTVAEPLTGGVMVLSYEMDRDQYAEWLRTQGLEGYGDRIEVWNLRNCANPLGSQRGRDEISARLDELDTELVVVDTFSRAFTGRDQNSAGEVQAWRSQLDQTLGDRDVLMTVHAGWDKSRARGSTSIPAHADSIITVEKAADGVRYLSVNGRGITERSGVALAWDPATMRMWVDPAAPSPQDQREKDQGEKDRAAEERQAKNWARVEKDLLALLADGSRPSARFLRKTVYGSEELVLAVLEQLVRAGRVLAEPNPGRGGGTVYRLPDPT